MLAKIQKSVQIIWKRWQNSSYLQKKEIQLPICKWIIECIAVLIPGADGKVRVVTVRMPRGLLKRNISNIAVLPIASK